MADSTAVFPAGFRVSDSTTGAALSGAVIRFYDAGTTTPKIVYADSGLATALGTSVTCDSLGYPTSNGTTKTQVYVGPADYKVRIETSTGAEIVTHDNVKGAVVSDTGGGTAVSATRPVVTKSLNYTVVTADQGKVFVGNCSSADVTFTLPSAVTVGDGWEITLQHAGSANQCVLATVASQTIAEGSKSFGSGFTLGINGESASVVSDGGNWRVVDHTTPFFKPGQGVITIADRLSAPPVSPEQGAAYIVTASPTGAWSTFALNDIAYYTGAGWVNFTPLADSGWLAFVQDEDVYYRFVGSAWVSETATTSTAGIVRLSDAAAVTAETAGRAVTADLLKKHKGVAKAWLTMDGTGTASLSESYGVSSIVDNGTGYFTVNFSTAFATATYAWSAGANFLPNGTNGTFITDDAKNHASFSFKVINVGGLSDLSRISLIFFGAQ